MNVFEYEALSKKGNKKSGVVLADSSHAAYETICAQTLIPINISAVRCVSSKILPEELLMFFLHIDFQLKCGLKINEAIDTFIDSHGNRVLNVKLLEVSNQLKAGRSLKEAFQNSVFDKVISGLLVAAEKTGNLAEIITNILDFLKLKKTWKDKVKSILAYPMFLTLISVAIMWFCIAVLGPQVISLLNDCKEVPALTHFAVYCLPSLSIAFTAIVLILAVLMMLFSMSPEFRIKLENYLLVVPRIGSILKKVTLWQFCKILQIALNSKLDFTSALTLGIESVSVAKIKTDLERVKSEVMHGHKIFEAFSVLDYIPKSVVSAIYIGEEGNNLNGSMEHISDELYKEILFELKSLGRTLSVGLTLLTGGIFIFILFSLFYPLYDYIEVIGK